MARRRWWLDFQQKTRLQIVLVRVRSVECAGPWENGLAIRRWVGQRTQRAGRLAHFIPRHASMYRRTA